MFYIKKEKWKEFVEEINKNVITKEFLAECKVAKSYFRCKQDKKHGINNHK